MNTSNDTSLRTTLLFWHFISFVCLTFYLPAQQAPINFESFTQEDGLPNNNVDLIRQDSAGFMWLSTHEGLVRYDGLGMKVFRHDPDDSTSLSISHVWSAILNPDGTIWLGTGGGGLNLYLPETETFIRFEHDPKDENTISNNYIRSLWKDIDGTLWIGTDNGLNRMTGFQNRQKEAIVIDRFYYDPKDTTTISGRKVISLFREKSGQLWAGTPNGLSQIIESNNLITFRRIGVKGRPEQRLSDRIVHVIQEDRYGHLWLGTGNGLNLMVQSEDRPPTFIHYLHDPQKPESISPFAVKVIFEDTDGGLWISTQESGLNYAPPSIVQSGAIPSLKFQHFRHDSQNPKGLKSNYIAAIFEDHNGLMWLGMFNGGAAKFQRKRNPFYHLTKDPDAVSTLSHHAVIPIYEDRLNNLWLGTENWGFNIYNRVTKEVQIFKRDPNNTNSLSSNLVLTINEDQQGAIWLGTFRGMNRVERLEEDGRIEYQFRHYTQQKDNPNSLSDRHIFAFYEEPKGVYWIGTRGGGLNRLVFESGDLDKPIYTHYKVDAASKNSLSDNYIWSIWGNNTGVLWVGTDKGVNRLNLDEKGAVQNFKHFQYETGNPNSLSSDLIGPIYSTGDSIIWVGTAGQGLNKLDFRGDPSFEEPKITRYRQQDGLPNDHVYGILEDDSGFLWLSTNNGISRFDPNFIPVDGQNFTDAFTNFSKKDGLGSNEFNTNGFYKNRKGELFFGGVDGLTYFHPDSLLENQITPPIVLTDFKLFNQSMPLPKAINETETIVLSYKENIFSFEFAALAFTAPSKNQFAYKMDGFQDDWIYLGNRNFATFTNLDPGAYVFHVKGSNHNGVWNQEGKSIRIRILAPPWKTWWAYMLYGFAFSMIAYLIFRDRVRRQIRKLEEKARIEKARDEERALLRKKNAADFHDELGHRLTKISLFLELAERQTNLSESLQGYLTKIKANSAGLSEGIRDLIWSLDPGKDTLYQTFTRLQEFGDRLFDYSDIEFKTRGNLEAFNEISLEPERRKHILLIFKEAMHNCLKYSEASTAVLQVSKEQDKIKLQFSDNGKGFEVSSNGGGYGLRNMRDRADKIKAKIYLNSTLEKGTSTELEFTIRNNSPH